jgi:hypothetical protein
MLHRFFSFSFFFFPNDEFALYADDLEQFPQVSSKVADAIVNAYPTAYALLAAYSSPQLTTGMHRYLFTNIFFFTFCVFYITLLVSYRHGLFSLLRAKKSAS